MTQHNHNHSPEISDADSQRRVLVALILIGCFMLVEVAGGVYSRSLALLADAGHMVSDFASLLLAWLAFRVGRRGADSKRSYGYHRFQVLASFVNALALFLISGWIVYEAIERFFVPEHVLAEPMLIVATMGLVVNIAAFWVLQGGDKKNLNVKGAAVHVLGDLLGSVAAIAAGLIILYTGWMKADPLLSILVALIILKAGWGLLRESSHILLEGTPGNIDPETLFKELDKAVPEVRNIHHVHIWSLTGNRQVLTMHAEVDEDTDHDDMQARIHAFLKSRFNIDHATVQLECGSCTDELKGQLT